MRQTLGSLLILILFTLNIFANVTAKLEPQALYKGEPTSLVITASGDDVKFPDITEINGVPIEGVSTSQSINMVNTHITKSISKSYRFRPTSSMKIPSFEVEVDGKQFKTNELELKVVKPSASRNGEPFVLEQKVNKSDVYVGEPIDLEVKFKYKMNAHAEQVQLGEPKLENFWIKKVEGVEQSIEGEYRVESVHYQLFAQKAGEYELPPLEALIGQKSQRRSQGGFFNDPFFDDAFFGSQLTWRKIYSNGVKLTVNPLPNGVELYGDFSIEATVDKQRVHANKPVNLTITVEGEGNIDDIKKFELELDNAIVYADEPKVTSFKGRNSFTQKIAIIADANFTIPPIELKFFDKTTQQVKTIQTKPIDIEVIGGGKGVMQPAKIEMSSATKVTPKEEPQQSTTQTTNKSVEVKKSSATTNYLYMLVGFVLGSGLTFAWFSLAKREPKKESDMVKAIRRAKDDKTLFELLLPYSKESETVAKALNKLEENLYKNGNHKIDKEELMEVFEEMV